MTEIPSQLDKLRFTVGYPGKPCSAIWSIFAHNNNVYLLSRPISHAAKISIHGDNGSLVCQVAYTTKYYAETIQHLPGATDRTFVRWKRQPTPRTGAVQVVALQFPTDYLVGQPKIGTAKKPLLVIPAVAPGKTVEVAVLYTRMPPEELEKRLGSQASLVGWFQLPNQDIVMIVSRTRKWVPPVLPSGMKLSSGVQFGLRSPILTEEQKQSAVDGSKDGKAFALLFNEPDEGGWLRVVEVGGVTLSKAEYKG